MINIMSFGFININSKNIYYLQSKANTKYVHTFLKLGLKVIMDIDIDI